MTCFARLAGIESGSIRNQLIDKLEQPWAQWCSVEMLRRDRVPVAATSDARPNKFLPERSVQLLMKSLADTLEVNIHEVRDM